MKRILALLLIGAIMACGAWAQDKTPPPPMIIVTGVGESRVSPDQATVRLGSVSRAATAAEAQNDANAVMQKLLLEVAKLKVDRKDVQTSNISLSPVYDNRPTQTPVIVGYEARNTISVRVKDLSLIGKVIDAGVAAGVNTVEGVMFGLDDDKASRADALRQAVLNAREKAKVIADALGVELGALQEVTEGGAFISPPPMYDGRMMAGRAEASTPVEPGQVTVSASVTIKYAIRQRA